MRKFSLFLVLLLAVWVAGGEAPMDEASCRKLHDLADAGAWIKEAEKRPVVTREALEQSIELARCYYLNNQRSDGNFVYILDITNGEKVSKDNQVRQAGALWGLASLYRDRPDDSTRRAVLLGLDYFSNKVNLLKNGQKCFVYPNEEGIRTGAVALYVLALTEYLRRQESVMAENEKLLFRTILDVHIKFLRSMEQEDGTWARYYDLETNTVDTTSSPYYDGEALLAYCKAARYMGYSDLRERIEHSMPRLIRKYTLDCWKNEDADDLCKGFCQWGCMAFAEYIEAGWEANSDIARDAAYALSWWLIYENKLVYRTGNTAYAVEGLVAAWRIAGHYGDVKTQDGLKRTVLEVMARLMSCQYKGPFMDFNPALKALENAPGGAEGGITMSRQDMRVRIDVVQHQTHAMLMMLKYMFEE